MGGGPSNFPAGAAVSVNLVFVRMPVSVGNTVGNYCHGFRAAIRRRRRGACSTMVRKHDSICAASYCRRNPLTVGVTRQHAAREVLVPEGRYRGLVPFTRILLRAC
jgi:hypothetical protein